MSYRRGLARIVCGVVGSAITCGAATAQIPEATQGKEAVSKDVLTGNVQKQQKDQKNKKKQKEMFVAGTTTLPPGRYKMINRDTNIEYVMTVDETGKMTVNDVKQHQNPQPATAAAPSAATPAAITAATPPTGAATATAAAATAAATGAAATAATDPAAQTTSSKLGSLIKREAAKQFARHGSKIESKIRHAVKGKL